MKTMTHSFQLKIIWKKKSLEIANIYQLMILSLDIFNFSKPVETKNKNTKITPNKNTNKSNSKNKNKPNILAPTANKSNSFIIK